MPMSGWFRYVSNHKRKIYKLEERQKAMGGGEGVLNIERWTRSEWSEKGNELYWDKCYFRSEMFWTIWNVSLVPSS